MSKDVKENNINLNKIDLIIHAIYDTETFKLLTKKFFEIFRIRNDLPTEKVKPIFEDFVYSTIADKIDELETPTKAKRLRKKHSKNAWDLKKRWMRMTLESMNKTANKLLKKEYGIVKGEFIKTGRIITAAVDSPEELLEIRKDFLEQWSSNLSYKISDYIYLEELSDSKINSAFSHDLILCVTKILQDEYEFDINKIIIKSPSQLAPGIFIPHTRGRKINHLNVARKDENLYQSHPYDAINDSGTQIDMFYEFNLDPNSSDIKNIDGLKLELTNQTTEKKAISKLFLDKQDLDIIRFAYSYSYLNSYTFFLSDLLKYLGLTDAKANYQKVRDKLMKLPFYTFYTETYEKDGSLKSQTSFNLFSRIHIEEINGRNAVQVTKAFVEEIERVSTELMYKNELKKLKLPQSINLAYLLEGRRSFEISQGVNIVDKKYTFDIEQLKWYVHLNNKNKLKDNMKYIEDGLKEIMENQFIIKKYDVGYGYFDIWFYEDVEKRKCLINNTVLSLPSYIVD
ncbi:hypothetical protein OD257_002696 [Clostridioides difficile]|nr:hypothetical protein [Clostridioides difficile]